MLTLIFSRFRKLLVLLPLFISAYSQALTIEENAPGFCSYDGSIQSTHVGAANNSYVNLSNEAGKGITWAVQASQAGNYTVQFRYANWGSQTALAAAIRINGVVVAHALPFPKTGAWSNWVNSAAFNIALNSGNNTIRLETTVATEFANIDSLTINGTGLLAGTCSGAGTPRSPNNGVIVQPLAPVLASTPNPVSGIDMARATSGEFDVTSSGQASYTVPIFTAPGSAGLAPKVSVGYSSGAGNGLMGLGWSLNAGGVISRCRQTEGQDKNALPITWSIQDRFCLNGERLVIASGSYGAPGSTYKTEIDSHARITAIGGMAGHPDHFKVEYKDGHINYFGKNDYLQNVAHHKLASDKTLSWLLTVVQDSAGNKIRYYYDFPGNTITDQPLLSSIKYAYGASSTNHSAEINFNWESRADRREGYLGGFVVRQNYILESITVSNQSQLLRTYRFAYNEGDVYTLGDNVSRLSHIYECAQTACLEPISFEWIYQDVSGFKIINTPQITPDGAIRMRAWGDINGDGILDFAWSDSTGGAQYAMGQMSSQGNLQYTHSTFESGTWKVPASSFSGFGASLSFIDYNADGYHDLVVQSPYGANIYLSKPQANGTWKLSATPVDSLPLSSTGYRPLFIDLNGDGLHDLINLNSLKAFYLKTDGSGFSSAVNIGVALPSYMTQTCSKIEVLRDETGDFNGDGRVDFIALVKVCQASEVRYEYHIFTSHLSSVSGIELRHFDQLSDLYADSRTNAFDYETDTLAGTFQVADINADGLSDVIIALNSNFNATPRHLQNGYPETPGPADIGYYLRDGGSFDGYKLSTGVTLTNKVNFPSSYILNSKLSSFVDFNGDGYLDIVKSDYSSAGNGFVEVRRWNTSTKTFSATTTKINIPFAILGQDSISYQDVNGDGAPELILYGGIYSPNNLGKIYILNNNHNLKPGSMVNKIINNLGHTIDIDYQNILSTKHYGRIKGISSSTIESVCQPTDMGNVCWGRQMAYANATAFYNAVENPFSNLSSGQQSINSPPLQAVFDGVSGMDLVTSVSQTAPSGNTNNPGQISDNTTIKSSYYYERMRYQAAGRGFLGFKTFTKIDHQTGIRSVNEYRQDWPFNGVVLFSSVYSHAGATLSNIESIFGFANCYDASGNANASCVSSMRTQAAINGTAALGAVQPIMKKRFTESNALKNNGATPGDLISETTETYRYDTKGNLLESASHKSSDLDLEPNSKTTINTYEYTGATWSMQQGRLQRLSTISSNNRYGAITRTSAFDYYQSGAEAGLLKTETVEPDNPDFTVATTHTYSMGNRISSSTTADGQTRKTEVEYDSLGRYVDKTYEFFTNGIDVNTPVKYLATQVTSRDKYGTPTLSRRYYSPSAFITHKTATTTFGTPYFSAVSTGEFTETQMGLGADAYGICPSDTKTWSLARMAGGAVTIQCEDLLGRVRRAGNLGFNGGNWSLVDTEYDKLGRIIRSSAPYASDTSSRYWTSYSYDILGRVTETRTPYKNIHVATTTHYENLNVVITNPKNQIRVEKRDLAGQVIEVVDPNNGTTTFAYDARGNMREMKDPAQNTTTIGYDVRDRKISMSDPDKGNWSYQYNRFNELTCQRDGKNQFIIMAYDIRGRMVSRNERSGGACDSTPMNAVTYWVYDKASNGLGQLESVYTAPVNNPAFRQRFKYDSRGRLSIKETSFSGHLDMPTTHHEKITYDQYNRVYQQFDAAREVNSFDANGIQYVYNERGYLQKVVDAIRYNGAQQSYYTINNVDARGNVSNALYGNGITQAAVYEPETGLTKRLTATRIYPSSQLQDLSLEWDEVGNLDSRHESGTAGQSTLRNIYETFGYDSLNRLNTWASSGDLSASDSISYDAIDNIRSKSSVGTYLYGNQCGSSTNAGPHAVCRAGTTNYNYDKNGNLTSDGNGRSLQYTIYDLPFLIFMSGHRTQFFYDPDRARYKRVDRASTNQITTTLSIGSVEKVYYPDGSVEWKRNIAGIGQITQTLNNQGVITSEAQRYYIKDHLGSISLITDEIGSVEHANYFDPWGRERKIITAASIKQWLADNTSFRMVNKPITTRGFTGHEHLAEVGLIHMNGRIYDANIARFVQADPIIQDPLRVQSLNRYSYVWNNPLNATDSSGFMRDPEEDDPADYAERYMDSESAANGDCGASCRAGIVESSRQANQLFFQQMDAMRFLAKTYNSSISGNSMGNAGGVVYMEEVADSGQSNAQKNSRADNSLSSEETRIADGTYFFGGAGIDGDYISDMNKALGEAGISDVHSIDRELWSGGTAADAGVGVFALRNEINLGDKINFQEKFYSRGDGKGQLNLVGYSYGSLVASHVAMTHVKKGGVVDNLVLVGSPISSSFLRTLQNTSRIKNVHIVNLTAQGDPIYAGMGVVKLFISAPKLTYQMTSSTGHFYYAPGTDVGAARRRELAKDLYGVGLR
jgi:RHS repeat-associated protein